MEDDAISSERKRKYRDYDIRTQVVGLIPPYICAFTVAHSAAPHGERVTRMCDGDFRTPEQAHDVALSKAIQVVDLILSDTEAYPVDRPPPKADPEPNQSA